MPGDCDQIEPTVIVFGRSNGRLEVSQCEMDAAAQEMRDLSKL